MPHLIDGNNLMFALSEQARDVGRAALAGMLGDFAEGGERVCVVFDGAEPDGALAEQIADGRVEVLYGAPRSADAVILERIASDTAPKRLHVVSTDRAIRRAARKRRCKIVRSEEFARQLLRRLAEMRRPPAPAEPPEKYHGPGPEEARQWHREFGLDHLPDEDDRWKA